MDYDFHYYATNTAARIAGWSREEAQAIAEAALFVDYCDYTNFGCTFHVNKQTLGVPVLTSQYLSTYEYKDANDPSIWVPFHFLPGNYEDERCMEGHQLRRVVPGVERSAYMCRPYSVLVRAMMDHTPAAYRGLKEAGKGQTALALVGVRMHVFIDTWAHQDFTGLEQGSINNCGPNVLRTWSDGAMTDLAIDANFTIREYDFMAAPPGVHRGHGRLGHLPDMGWLQCYYQPAWAKSEKGWVYHKRTNGDEYTQAFLNMVAFLYAIRTGKEQKPEVADATGLSPEDQGKQMTDPDRLLVPSTLIDLIKKEQTMGSVESGAFPSAANDWCRMMLETGLLAGDPLRNMKPDGSYDLKWEKNLVAKYKNDFTVEGVPVIGQPWKRPAALKEGSGFLSYQEAAAIHLNFFLDRLAETEALADGQNEVLQGWSLENSGGFRKRARELF